MKGFNWFELFKNVINKVDFDIVFFEFVLISIYVIIFFNIMSIVEVDEK